jgi:hypothetical protein
MTMTMRGEEAAAMLPEPRPDVFAVCLRQLQTVQRLAREELKPAFLVNGRERLQLRLHLEQKHQPMRLALETVFADEAGEMQVARGELLAGFFVRLAAGAGVGRFAFVRVQLAAAWTPQATIRLLRAFEQEDFIVLVEAVEQRGDFVGQLHARSEAGSTARGKRCDGEQFLTTNGLVASLRGVSALKTVRKNSPHIPSTLRCRTSASGFSVLRFEIVADYFQIMSATVLPAGMNGMTCSLYGTTTSST